MTSKLTRERLQEIAEDGFLKHGESKVLARMALAAMDSEPVAFIDKQWTLVYYVPPMNMGLQIGDKLYRHAQQPVVPDDYQHLRELYHAQEKRLFKIAQRIKGPTFDKYSHSPSQAIDVLEAAIFGEDDACRSAMLQASPVCTCPSGDGSLRWPCPVHPGNSPAIPDSARDALEKALAAMEFMGDTLNNLDAVCTEDVELVAPAFDAVRNVLAAAQQEGK